MLFRDRTHAGRELGSALERFQGTPGVLVLALPRGGVPVGFEVARRLACPLDLCLVRKLGVPGWEELAMGAIASGGAQVLNEDVVSGHGITGPVIAAVAAGERRELERRERLYRAGRPPLDVKGKTVILVDDGLATGSTMKAALLALRAQAPGSLVVAVPVSPPETLVQIEGMADQVVCLSVPPYFAGVGQFYQEFGQTSDEEVIDLLRRAGREVDPSRMAVTPPALRSP